MIVNGRLIMIKDTTVVGKDLQKRQIVINTEDKNQICIDFLWENVKLLDIIKEGDEVSCEFSLAINIASNGAIFQRISWTSISKS